MGNCCPKKQKGGLSLFLFLFNIFLLTFLSYLPLFGLI
jgi:hypothetical protein